MTHIGGVLGFALHLILVLQQSLATVAPPTTDAPHKNLGRPERGHYQVTGTNDTVCLLAYMGLQFNISFTSASLNKTVQEVINLQPNLTKTSGSCGADRASLRLSLDADKTNLTFFFTLNTTSNKYHLSEISLDATWPDMKEPFSVRNATLDYLRGTRGFSYMCREEQTLAVVPQLSINTFQLQVQPFNVTKNQFGAAEECKLDKEDMLIAIVVGAALAGLVLIVLVAYLIGRRRSHAGYQTI
ncbi:lysosome-associated membrane glycoprotein 1b [Nerophis lumbriciformis]|uniref:lysosome-associated membrane glycoprotein 1b n=1 Tax=Nerophis lumbriciformis TaxID=546530 RepID=UPI002AE01A81|nr:lysosome-associated membrane glycoprotein 1-like [Nerophis lumbriciformis]XP_061827276.1 lysosome-associated membrane glycoprotein 1-like [Nerophis lumbriciformis]